MADGTQVKIISVRKFATQIGVSEGAVRKAISSGRFKIGVDPTTGKIDHEAAKNDDWVQKQSIIKPRAGVSRAKVLEKIDSAELNPNNLEDDDDLLSGMDLTEGDLASKIKITLGLSSKQAYKLKEIVDLSVAKIKLQELEGSLVRKDAVEKTLFAYGVELKKALFNMAQRVVREIMVAPTEVDAITIYNIELTKVLEAFGNFKKDLSTNE